MRFSRKIRLVLCLAGLVVFAAACSTPTVQVVHQKANWPDAEQIFAAGFSGISGKYIDPLTVERVAADGLRGFAAIDPALGINQSAKSIALTYAGKPVLTTASPEKMDIDGWAKLTLAFAKEARRYSADMRTTDAEKLYEAVFDGVLSKLDIYSRYAGAEDARKNRARRDGFGGIGIRFRLKDHALRIVNVTPDTPAAKSGLRVDDIIWKIDGKSVTGLSASQVTSKIRGPVHTTLILSITRDGRDDLHEHTLARAHIVPTTVTEKRLNDVLYLKISSFNQDTAQTLSEKLKTAMITFGDRLKGVVVDIRGNPGGLLKQSVKAADLFLSQGQIISTKGRHADSLHNYEAGGRDLISGLPMLVLVDGKSASAAEIVAVALQDRERAVLIGTSSYGKGTVQTVLRLPNEGEIILTWSRLIAPSGYTLHGLGVRPSICTDIALTPTEKRIRQTFAARLETIATFGQWRTPGLGDKNFRQRLRSTCPSGRRKSDTELKLALQLIDKPEAYAQAMSLSTIPNQAHK